MFNKINNIYVDFDGTLINNSLEDSLFNHQANNNLAFDDLSSLWDYYDKLVNSNDNMGLNVRLLNQLIDIKKRYYVNLHIWTNRSYDLKAATIRNLGEYANLFDSFNFYSGHKIDSIVDGIVLDNDAKYLNCGRFGGIKIKF